MKNRCYVCTALAATLLAVLAFFAETNAQNRFSDNNFNPIYNRSADETALVLRPRVYAEKPAGAKREAVAPAAIFDLEKQAFALINEKRREQNLKSLEWNDAIAKMARQHSQNMADHKFFSHTGLDGSIVSDRADRANLGRWRAVGENIAYNRGYAQPIEFAVERWLQSPSHKRNLLNEQWRESAVGIAVTPEGTYYFTQVFMRK